MTDFPPDLPDLLRLACASGKLRLTVWFGSDENRVGRHQANVANSGEGWTVEYHRDSLEAITAALRVRYGKMLERQRAGDPNAAAAVHPAHREAGVPVQLDLEDAIAAAVDVDGLIG